MLKLLEPIKLFGVFLLLFASPTTSMAQGGAVDDVIQGGGGQSLRETFSNHAAEIAIREAREHAAREASERINRQITREQTSPATPPAAVGGNNLSDHAANVKALLDQKAAQDSAAALARRDELAMAARKIDLENAAKIAREKQIPQTWSVRESNNGNGIIYSSPANPKHTDVRFGRANPNATFESQRADYVKHKVDGTFYDVNRNPVASGSLPEAHIPYENYTYWN